MKVIDASGNVVKSKFQVANEKYYYKYQMMELFNGNVLITWGNDILNSVYGKVIDASGNILKPEFRLIEFRNNKYYITYR